MKIQEDWSKGNNIFLGGLTEPSNKNWKGTQNNYFGITERVINEMAHSWKAR